MMHCTPAKTCVMTTSQSLGFMFNCFFTGFFNLGEYLRFFIHPTVGGILVPCMCFEHRLNMVNIWGNLF